MHFTTFCTIQIKQSDQFWNHLSFIKPTLMFLLFIQMGLATISHMLNQWIESDEHLLICTMSRGGIKIA